MVANKLTFCGFKSVPLETIRAIKHFGINPSKDKRRARAYCACNSCNSQELDRYISNKKISTAFISLSLLRLEEIRHMVYMYVSILLLTFGIMSTFFYLTELVNSNVCQICMFLHVLLGRSCARINFHFFITITMLYFYENQMNIDIALLCTDVDVAKYVGRSVAVSR